MPHRILSDFSATEPAPEDEGIRLVGNGDRRHVVIQRHLWDFLQGLARHHGMPSRGKMLRRLLWMHQQELIDAGHSWADIRPNQQGD